MPLAKGSGAPYNRNYSTRVSAPAPWPESLGFKRSGGALRLFKPTRFNLTRRFNRKSQGEQAHGTATVYHARAA